MGGWRKKFREFRQGKQMAFNVSNDFTKPLTDFAENFLENWFSADSEKLSTLLQSFPDVRAQVSLSIQGILANDRSVIFQGISGEKFEIVLASKNFKETFAEAAEK